MYFEFQLFRSSEGIAFGHAERESRTDLPIAFRGYLCGELPVVGFVQDTGDFDVERIVECGGITRNVFQVYRAEHIHFRELLLYEAHNVLSVEHAFPIEQITPEGTEAQRDFAFLSSVII